MASQWTVQKCWLLQLTWNKHFYLKYNKNVCSSWQRVILILGDKGWFCYVGFIYFIWWNSIWLNSYYIYMAKCCFKVISGTCFLPSVWPLFVSLGQRKRAPAGKPTNRNEGLPSYRHLGAQDNYISTSGSTLPLKYNFSPEEAQTFGESGRRVSEGGWSIVWTAVNIDVTWPRRSLIGWWGLLTSGPDRIISGKWIWQTEELGYLTSKDKSFALD